ncbi:hypothetical protein AB0N31_10600 [Streptomyces sp. NPDC051051]|uniref:hypothetical protein n=1 Tax=Streptomyces sp. NPDC051051 TaxID=3155666 RepID=UPI003438D0E0
MPADYDTPYGPRTAVAEWLCANDVDPNGVPIEGPITIEPLTLGGQRCIRYDALLRNEDGHLYVDPATGEAAREERTAILKVAPPENVQVRDESDEISEEIDGVF